MSAGCQTKKAFGIQSLNNQSFAPSVRTTTVDDFQRSVVPANNWNDPRPAQQQPLPLPQPPLQQLAPPPQPQPLAPPAVPVETVDDKLQREGMSGGNLPALFPAARHPGPDATTPK